MGKMASVEAGEITAKEIDRKDIKKPDCVDGGRAEARIVQRGRGNLHFLDFEKVMQQNFSTDTTLNSFSQRPI
jgi:hypothetical protein